MTDTRLADSLKLIDHMLAAANPYDPRLEPRLWQIYNFGLLKGIIARLAANDWLLRQELEARARHARSRKPPV